MKALFKSQYKNIILVPVYILIASIVYGIWFHSLWGLWYVTLITILTIIIIGVTIGYFYIKSELNKEKNIVENKE